MDYGKYTPEELERMADKLLEKDLKNKKAYKFRHDEYPILSESQLKRRRRREIPTSCLSNRDRVYLGLKREE